MDTKHLEGLYTQLGRTIYILDCLKEDIRTAEGEDRAVIEDCIEQHNRMRRQQIAWIQRELRKISTHKYGPARPIGE